MLTKDEMYDLYFNNGYVIAVRLDEFGAFVGDLIDRDYITWDDGREMYKKAKKYTGTNRNRITWWFAKVYDTSVPLMFFRETVLLSVSSNRILLYSAQDTVMNIKRRISESQKKIKDNNDTIKKYKDEIKELYRKIGNLRIKNTSMYMDSVLKDESWLKRYGIDT